MGPQPHVDAFAEAFAEAFEAPDAAGGSELQQQQEEITDTLEQAVQSMNAALGGTGVSARIGPWMAEPGYETRQVVLERASDGFEANAFRLKWEWGTGYPVRVRLAGHEDDEVATDHSQLVAHLRTALQRAALVAHQMA